MTCSACFDNMRRGHQRAGHCSSVICVLHACKEVAACCNTPTSKTRAARAYYCSMGPSAAVQVLTLVTCMSGERDAVRSRALRLLLPGGIARDSAAASAAFTIVAEALRAGELAARDTDLYGRALAMCAPRHPRKAAHIA